jgi:hypothetical protein
MGSEQISEVEATIYITRTLPLLLYFLAYFIYDYESNFMGLRRS